MASTSKSSVALKRRMTDLQKTIRGFEMEIRKCKGPVEIKGKTTSEGKTKEPSKADIAKASASNRQKAEGLRKDVARLNKDYLGLKREYDAIRKKEKQLQELRKLQSSLAQTKGGDKFMKAMGKIQNKIKAKSDKS